MRINHPAKKLLTCCSLLLLLLPTLAVSDSPVINYQYRVINQYPHSTEVFTQGLEFHQGLLYEGSGQRGHSMVQTRSLDSIQAIRQTALDDRLFGEGITILGDKLYQLTWQSKRGFVYDKNTLAPEAEFTIRGQGWGITNNGQQLIYSDGSNQLRFLNPHTFNLEQTLSVNDNGKAVNWLNELEWVDGLIYANVWRSHWIVIIDPQNGKVVGRVNLKHLLPDKLRSKRTDVLNGIAYDKTSKRLFVTGKYWPRLYQIELIDGGSGN
jgi:glutamine cyclotransferase